ncbi:MAG: oxidoreductase, partial [Nocardia sp.]|nr:oxidoreductase [Nocardia sp.]
GEKGVTIHRHATVRRITTEHVEFRVGDETLTAPADLVVMASGVSAQAPLADALAGVVPEVYVVGDAVEVDYIEGAIHTAWKVATAL